ncbi:hypothetical protein BV898_17800 [Hypsibius exemplaris]|uniref:Uncharacterized protein n=1 Tax=Hypsibius exemplaris TaxID=2072580 RepID=A0A9X6NFY9_HYPEX|nr:hypothetical protein BV898_17800 [Hypsibius exemplaris]
MDHREGTSLYHLSVASLSQSSWWECQLCRGDQVVLKRQIDLANKCGHIVAAGFFFKDPLFRIATTKILIHDTLTIHSVWWLQMTAALRRLG